MKPVGDVGESKWESCRPIKISSSVSDAIRKVYENGMGKESSPKNGGGVELKKKTVVVLPKGNDEQVKRLSPTGIADRASPSLSTTEGSNGEPFFLSSVESSAQKVSFSVRKKVLKDPYDSSIKEKVVIASSYPGITEEEFKDLEKQYGSLKAFIRCEAYIEALKAHEVNPEKFQKPKLLDLSNCRLETLPPILLSRVLDGVTSINLSYNKLSEVSKDSLPPELINLNLSYNELSEVSKDSLPLKLRNLNLSHNKITRFQDLSKFSQLQKLDLSYNKISEFNRKERPNAMSILNLDGNDELPLLVIQLEQLENERMAVFGRKNPG